MNKEKVKKTIDFRIGNFLVEVKIEISAARTLRNSILDISYKLISNNEDFILLLINPEMTTIRIKKEFEKIKKVLMPEVSNHLTIIINREEEFTVLGKSVSYEIENELKIYTSQLIKEKGIRLHKVNIYSELLKVMIYKFLNNDGPLTTEWLAKEAIGCSYPPVAKALKNSEEYIKRYPDRRVELKRFPIHEWNKLLVMSNELRSTINFKDVSGQPRRVNKLIERIRSLRRKDIGIGGIPGAKYYYPDLNISGSNRLDLSICNMENEFDPEFIEYLDPALKKTQDPEAPVQVAIHFIRRKNPFFAIEPSGEIWADPVECLLDLHEARLETQAEEFLRYMLNKKELLISNL